MNTKLIATLMTAAFVALPSFAHDVHASGEVGYIPPITGEPSTRTRAEVIAELLQAPAAAADAGPAGLTRAQVLAELLQAQRDGTVPPTAEGADIGALAARRPDAMEPQPVLAAR